LSLWRETPWSTCRHRAASRIASGPQEREHLLKILDDPRVKNGYQDPRKFMNRRRRNSNNRKSYSDDRTVLISLNFISDSISNRIRHHIRQNHLPIKVSFSPAGKLRNIVYNNRPCDKKKCINNSCLICPFLITGNRDFETVKLKMLFMILDVRYVMRFTSERPFREFMIDWENIWGTPNTHWHHRMLTK
jgi:hypothetical protein